MLPAIPQCQMSQPKLPKYNPILLYVAMYVNSLCYSVYITQENVYPFLKCYNFSTNSYILNLFVLFDIEFKCTSISAYEMEIDGHSITFSS